MKNSAFDNLPGVTSLAYLGDAVFELSVRERLVKEGIASPEKLNSRAIGYVSAVKQSESVERILFVLDEDEIEIFKRGRNHKPKNRPKSAEREEYRRATGLETLFGALYFCGMKDRIDELISIIFEGESRKNDV